MYDVICVTGHITVHDSMFDSISQRAPCSCYQPLIYEGQSLVAAYEVVVVQH